MSGRTGRRLGRSSTRRGLAVLVVLLVFCGAGFGLLQSGEPDANVASNTTVTATPSDPSDASGRDLPTPIAGANSSDGTSVATEENEGTAGHGGASTPSASENDETTESRRTGEPSERTGETNDGNTDDGSGDGGSAPVKLAVGRVADESLRFDDAVPGSHGVVRLSARNDGPETGELSVRVRNVVDTENGLLEPERDGGDDDTEGELSSALSVRVSVGDDYLVGGDDEWVPLSELEAVEPRAATLSPGVARTLTVEWRVDPTAGNEIQSDVVTVDVRLVLSQTA